MEKLKEATIAVYHHDCYCSDSTEKFPGIKLTQESPIVYLTQNVKKMKYQILWSITAGSSSELNEYFEYLKQDHRTDKLVILKREPTKALFFHRITNQSSSYEAVLKTDVIYSSPVRVEKGLEIHEIISVEPIAMQKTLKELEAVGETKILRLGDYKPQIDKYGLTKKQKKALAMALDNGYYHWPKDVNLDELAAMEKISRRSLQERLRRAESKIIPKAIEDALKE